MIPFLVFLNNRESKIGGLYGVVGGLFFVVFCCERGTKNIESIIISLLFFWFVSKGSLLSLTDLVLLKDSF